MPAVPAGKRLTGQSAFITGRAAKTGSRGQCVSREPRVEPYGRLINAATASRPPFFVRGPARPDHQPEQTGENGFGETDRPVEPEAS